MRTRVADDTEPDVAIVYKRHSICSAVMRAFAIACVIFVASQSRAEPEHALDVGRIFLTPQQRAELDSMRSRAGDETNAATASRPSAVSAGEDIVLNGIIRRSHGPSTVWINGRAVNRDTADRVGIDLHSGPDAKSRVKLSTDDGHALALKPGQAWLRDTGRIVDCADCRARPKPEPQSPNEPDNAEADQE